MLLGGDLSDAKLAAERAWERARDGLRQHEGMPTQESMSACDAAGRASIEVSTAIEGVEGARRAPSESSSRFTERGRNKLAQLNRYSIIPIGGPTGEVDPDELLSGGPSARIALLDGDAEGARRILLAQVSALTARERDSHSGAQHAAAASRR